MKARTQIQLEKDELMALKALARRRQLSVSELARQAIRRELSLPGPDDQRAIERMMAAAGCGTEPDGSVDVARAHDAYVYGGRQ